MNGQTGITIIYDGECPFCAAYVRMIRLRDAAGPVTLVDARSDQPAVAEMRAAGFDPDRGMAAKLGGTLYHGQDAMRVLSLLTTRSGVFNRLARLMFSRPPVARVIYPVLVAGRNIILRLLGRRRLGDAN